MKGGNCKQKFVSTDNAGQNIWQKYKKSSKIKHEQKTLIRHCINMREYGFSLTRVLPYKNRIYDSVFIRENPVSESHSRIFYAV